MCSGSAQWNPSHPRRRSSSFRRRSSSFRRQSLTLHRKRITVSMEARRKDEMEVRNLRLYMENQCIIEENQKLKNAALLLRQENSLLLLQLQQKLASLQPKSVAKTN